MQRKEDGMEDCNLPSFASGPYQSCTFRVGRISKKERDSIMVNRIGGIL